MSHARVIIGDCREVLRTLPDESVHCVVTSPPYWGLRDYGVDGQIGLEPSLSAWVDEMVAVFREVRRVLRADGTCWVNLGDGYTSGGRSVWRSGKSENKGHDVLNDAARPDAPAGLKPKDLIGQPWRVAFALQADGWYLRSEIIWHKANPMPESIKDRPTKAHEQIFLLSKSERYCYDQAAIAEPAHGAHARGPKVAGWASGDTPHTAVAHNTVGVGKNRRTRKGVPNGAAGVNPKATQSPSGTKQNESFSAAVSQLVDVRNARTVWTFPTEGFSEAHFATFPRELPRRCILAGCPVGGTVLDPFNGSGTTGQVALELGRSYIGIELNEQYAAMTERRLSRVTLGLPLEAA